MELLNLEDLKKFVSLGLARVALAIGAALTIQLGAIYVVWDALNSRMDDLSRQQVTVTNQLGAIKEDIGFIKARYRQFDDETERRKDIEQDLQKKIEALVAKQSTTRDRVEVISSEVDGVISSYESLLDSVNSAEYSRELRHIRGQIAELREMERTFQEFKAELTDSLVAVADFQERYSFHVRAMAVSDDPEAEYSKMVKELEALNAKIRDAVERLRTLVQDDE